MYQKILLAFDGSPDGREALDQAEDLASASGAAVHLLAIIDPTESMLIVEAMTFIPDNQRFVIQTVLDEGVKLELAKAMGPRWDLILRPIGPSGSPTSVMSAQDKAAITV